MRGWITVSAMILVSASVCGCGSPAPSSAAPPTAESSATAAPSTQDLKIGTGPTAQRDQTVSVNYTGWLFEAGAPDHKGKKFDSSLDAGQPFSFKLGAGDVIKGWDEGVAGMMVGGKRRLIIPPDMGYGDSGAGGVIPPGATLVFDIELLAINGT